MKKILLFLGAMFVCTAHAQTETTKWYIDGNLYATTSCESGGDITMPEPPERFGSIFQGWMPAVYDMSTLDTSINFTTSGYDLYKTVSTFSYGKVYGEVLCSSTSEQAFNTTGDINTEPDSGGYCYCRVTEFIPTDSNVVYSPKVSRWVYAGKLNSAASCSAPNACSYVCCSGIDRNATFRAKMYGVQ